jgi:omega-6 fatty acid desaturase (delta-12 desaturase)
MDDLSRLLDDLSIGKMKEKTDKINETELYQKYKSTYESACMDLGKHALFLWGAFYAMYLFKDSYMTIITIPLMSFMLIRTFVVFHDCQHGSYTPSPILNYILSHITGFFVLTSPDWIINHHKHHLTNGNIDNKHNYRFNELIYFNVNQYKNFNTIEKYLFVFIYNPIVFFTVFPFLLFFILQRFVYIFNKRSYKDSMPQSMFSIIINHIVNNIGICGILYMTYKYEIMNFFLFSLFTATSIGFFLFFNQHTYNPAYVVNNDIWTQKNSGILGSSFIQIPYWLKYFTMGIEYHHIHHMNPKIPGYHINKYHDEVIQTSTLFDPIVKLSLWDCYQNIWLVLYDEDNNKYVRLDDLEEYAVIKKWFCFFMSECFFTFLFECYFIFLLFYSI